MKRALVAVGVDKTASPLFQPLNAAAAGAQDMADWAKQQSFDVTLLTDKSAAVTVTDVFNAVYAYVNAAVYDQLVVYFSGHGVLLAPYAETWLLSGAVNNPSEAINLAGSIAAARTCGIPHVVFISDACRSLPQNFMVGSITPGSVFPTQMPKRPRPKVDVLYATLPGSVALELPPAQANANYRGLFTECLLKALAGVPPSLIETVPDGLGVKHVVAPGPLSDYLEQAVPAAAAAVSIALVQEPDATVESRLPKYLAEVVPPTPGAPSPDSPDSTKPGVFLEIVRRRPPARLLSQAWSEWVSRPEPERFEVSDHVLGEGAVRKSFETILEAQGFRDEVPGADFVFHGLEVESVKVTGNREEAELFRPRGPGPIQSRSRLPRRPDGEKRVALIRFSNGSGMTLPVVAGYAATVVAEEGRVLTVNYTPSRYNMPTYFDWKYGAETIERSRALIAALARNGSFRVDPDNAQNTARLLRRFKKVDPTLGLFAAYAYAQGGDGEGVLSVFRYMFEDGVLVPWDVAMLANRFGVPDRSDDAPWRRPPRVLDFAPWMPLLTQGWMLLGQLEEFMPDVLRHARRYLLPGLWTTFAAPGIEILEEALFGREWR
jgi:hypothetical protein